MNSKAAGSKIDLLTFTLKLRSNCEEIVRSSANVKFLLDQYQETKYNLLR